MQVREKVGKSRNCVFPIICGPGGSKSRLAKAAGAEPSGQMIARRCGTKHISKSKCTKHTSSGPLLEVEMSKKCTPLWREAHVEVTMLKSATFGSWDVEKVHAVVAWSTFRSQHVQNTTCSRHFWTFRCQVSFCVAGARGCGPCQKWAKREGFVAFPKTMAGVGHLNRICKDAFSVAGAVQKTCSSDMLGGQSADFLRGVAFWSIRCVGLLSILRHRCSTSYDLASIFRGRRSTLDRWSGKIAKGIGTRPSALHSTFHFWRRSRRTALFLMLSNSKIEEVSQSLLRFGCCLLRKLRTSRRITLFLMLATSKNEEVS